MLFLSSHVPYSTVLRPGVLHAPLYAPLFCTGLCNQLGELKLIFSSSFSGAALCYAVFKWDNGNPHNLWKVEKADYDNCLNSTTSKLLAGGDNGTPKGSYSYLVTASKGAVLYFICTVDGFHCWAGMKIAISVA